MPIAFVVAGVDQGGRPLARLIAHLEPDGGTTRLSFSGIIYPVISGMGLFEKADGNPSNEFVAAPNLEMPALTDGNLIFADDASGWPDGDTGTAIRLLNGARVLGRPASDHEALALVRRAFIRRNICGDLSRRAGPSLADDLVGEAVARRLNAQPDEALVMAWMGSIGLETKVLRHKGRYCSRNSLNGTSCIDMGLSQPAAPGLWHLTNVSAWDPTGLTTSRAESWGLEGDFTNITVADAAGWAGCTKEEMSLAMREAYPYIQIPAMVT